MSTPSISVVLPTFNGVTQLPPLLAALDRARAEEGVEVVAIDSGSTDGTPELLRSRVDTLLAVGPEGFNHGASRNQGIAASRGELVVLIVQDAQPEGADWLQRLTRPLREDPRVAGSYCRQLPLEGASVLTRHYLEQWIASSSVDRVSELESPGQLERMNPFERYLLCVFDNVCSCIRRSVWKDIPFPRTSIAEDIGWAREALMAGHRLVYVADAAVRHSHERSALYEFWRTYLTHQRLSELFGLRTVPSATALLRSIAATVTTHARCVAGERPWKPREIPRALALALAWPLGQYFGGSERFRLLGAVRPSGV